MNKKIFILGMARSGYEVAKVLSEHNNQITITDEKDQKRRTGQYQKHDTSCRNL